MEAPHTVADRHPIGYWLKLVDQLIDQNFDAILGSAALTRRHWQILNFLQDAPATYAEIDDEAAPYLAPHMPTVRPVVDDLCSRGWAALTSAGKISLTEVGAKAHQDLLAGVAASRDRISAGIDKDEYAATIDVLRRMATNLGWSETKDMGPIY